MKDQIIQVPKKWRSRHLFHALYAAVGANIDKFLGNCEHSKICDKAWKNGLKMNEISSENA